MAQQDDIIKSKVFPMIRTKLSTSNIKSKYKQCIGRFMEKRSEQLNAIAPYDRIYFGDEDYKDLFNSIGINDREIQKYIKETYYGKITNFNPRAAKDPIAVCLICIIRYFYIESKKNKKLREDLEISMIYLSFSGSFYPSIHYGSYPVVQPSEYPHIMDYVINNLLSNKFDLKREGSIFGAIRSIDNTWLESYPDLLDHFSDDDVVYLIQQLHTRIKSFMKNIADLYYKTYNDKDHIFTYDNDNLDDSNYHLADNDSLKIERAVESTMNYINTHNVDFSICKKCADSNVRADEVKMIIEHVLTDKNNIEIMKDLVRCIITDYYQNDANPDLRNLSFLSYTLKTKPNSKNNLVLKQKEIINNWLMQYSKRYAGCKRNATISSYFKSILGYFTVLISRSNK